MHSPAVEDYLKAIWALQQDDAPVATSRIADRLRVSPAAVTAMVKRLAEQALLDHEPYRGAQLSPAGERAALRIIRRHRVLELFLTEMLDYPWDRVHEEAERLEHAASDELIERLAALLGEPERDPHGNAIPTAAGGLKLVALPTLAEFPAGAAGAVVEVCTEEPEQLRYLGELGLYPGARVEVRGAAPFEGPLTLTVEDRREVISHALARRVRVRPAGRAEMPDSA